MTIYLNNIKIFKKILKNNTQCKNNIKKFIKKNKSIIDKHDNDTELRLDENSPDYVFKEFKRLVKQWKYVDEFNELIARYPQLIINQKEEKITTR